MLFAVSLMVKVGIAGSLMSLGAIDFGLVVDGSVVVVENTLRRLAERRREVGVIQTVLEATVDVARPIAFGVGIIIAVYLPILTLQGVEGKLFTPMAATVVFALLGSLLLTFTVSPVLASLLFRRPVSAMTSSLCGGSSGCTRRSSIAPSASPRPSSPCQWARCSPLC
jgi:cobalt-zinc-cadmium resistance protein CzcA